MPSSVPPGHTVVAGVTLESGGRREDVASRRAEAEDLAQGGGAVVGPVAIEKIGVDRAGVDPFER